ncbi:MAG: GDP-mannose 4,6-dehydratase, partial [Bacteroidales bacterium]|nr:GDP-mannose 4,6-dehydratase [Bacteroidales bacterium]
RSLYGASKLASELFVAEYNELFNIRTIINRCGVISGPWQMGKVDQGVVVLWLARHFWKKELRYIGYGGLGKQVRDVIDIQDLFHLIDYQIHNIDSLNGEIFNVGGGKNQSVSLLELTKMCEELTGNKINIKNQPENRKADIRIYITDNSKITSATGWEPKISSFQTLENIYHWLKDNNNALEKILNQT